MLLYEKHDNHKKHRPYHVRQEVFLEAIEKEEQSVLDRKIVVFELENQPIEKGLRILAKDYGLRFGFENQEDQK